MQEEREEKKQAEDAEIAAGSSKFCLCMNILREMFLLEQQSRPLSTSLGSIKLRVQVGDGREGMIKEMCQELCQSEVSRLFIVGSLIIRLMV